jgi:hypothetical protein
MRPGRQAEEGSSSSPSRESLVWRRHSRVALPAGRPPACRPACRPRSTKTCVSLLPWSLAVDLGCWPYPLSYSFASSEHTRTARPAPRVPFGGRLSEIYSSDPPRLPFLQPPLSPLVAQSDDPLERSNDTAGTRACRSRDFSWSTSVSLAMLNCVLRDTG